MLYTNIVIYWFKNKKCYTRILLFIGLKIKNVIHEYCYLLVRGADLNSFTNILLRITTPINISQL
jgi:hypothetical protein